MHEFEHTARARRRAACLALSVGIHVVLVTAVAWLWARGPEGREAVAFHAVDLVEEAREAPAPAAAPQAQEASVERGPAARQVRARPEASEPVPERPVEPPEVEEEAAPEPAGNPFKLSYGVLAETLGPIGVQEQEPVGVEAMLDGYAKELEAYKTVKYGKYDPELVRLRDGMEAYWHPEFDQIGEGPLKGSVGKMLEGWQKKAKKYGKTGSMGDDPATSAYFGDVRPEDLGVLDTYEQLEKSDAFTTSARLVVEIEFDGKGGWKAEKVVGSGHGLVDDAAVDAVEEALGANPELIPAYPARTRWALEADFSVTPPLPVAGFTFDLGLGYFDWAYPLKKKVSRRIKLLAVEKPAAPVPKGGGANEKMSPAGALG